MIGSLYLLFGMYMGGAGDFSMASVHARIGLLGFTLMAVFACVHKLFPAMTGGMLATVPFLLRQVGTLVPIIMLLLLVSGNISEAGIAPLAEALVLSGSATFAYSAFRNAS